MSKRKITISGTDISINDDFIDIDHLNFLVDNPRVYDVTHGNPEFSMQSPEEQQEFIYKKLLKQSSVKSLIPSIKQHGGLMEPILIRVDTMEVIEGNSRLAVFRKLKNDNADGEWDLIPCDMVESLSKEQQLAFLSQIHVKGKTPWLAYEKANIAYTHNTKDGWDYKKIAKHAGVSEVTIRRRVEVIKMMKDNHDTERSHFSYYDVITHSKPIKDAIKNEKLSNLLSDIKKLGSDEESNSFTALDLRKKLPIILKKPKVLKKYNGGEYDLNQAYQYAEISSVENKVRNATDILDDVSKRDVEALTPNSYNAFKQDFRKLMRGVTRIENMIEKIDQ